MCRHSLIRRQHELFDNAMRDIPRTPLDADHLAKLVELDQRLGQIEIDGAALESSAHQDLREHPHHFKAIDQRLIPLPQFLVPLLLQTALLLVVALGATPATAADANVAKAEADLLLANAQRDQMNQRMDDLQKQLQALQQALQSRDQQVQALQAELDRRQGTNASGNAAAASAPTANAPTNAVAAAPDAVAPAPQSAPAPSVAQPATPTQDAQGSGFNFWPWLGAGALGALLVGLLFARRKREDKPVEMPPVRAAAEPIKPLPAATPLAAAVVAPVPVPHPVVIATPEAHVAEPPKSPRSSTLVSLLNGYVN